MLLDEFTRQTRNKSSSVACPPYNHGTLPLSSPVSFPQSLSCCLRSIIIICPPIRFFSHPTSCSLLSSLPSPFYSSPQAGWVEDAPRRVTNELRRRMTVSWGEIQPRPG